MIVRAILVDPFNKGIRLLHREMADTQTQYAVVRSYDVAKLDLAPNLSLLIDQFGAFRRGQSWWILGTLPIPLSGHGVLVGRDPETGEIRDVPYLSASTIAEQVEWINPEDAKSMFAPTDPPMGFETLPMPVVAVT